MSLEESVTYVSGPYRRSRYYSWRTRGESCRLVEERALREVLWAVHLESR